eukprot:949034_1
MKTVLFFVANYMCFVMSQIPLNLTGWSTLSSASQTNCETIGGYRSTSQKISIYGGSGLTNRDTDAKYVYSPNSQSYDSTTTTLNSVSSAEQAVQMGDMLYYYDSSSSSIMEYDMSSDTVRVASDLSEDIVQDLPAMCFDDMDSSKLYVVGDNEIETCVIGSGTSTCSAVTDDALEMLIASACEVYNGTIYVFGGVDKDSNAKSETFACDASASSNGCVELDASAWVSVARGGIRSVRVPCFADNYVVLIGGRLDLDVASNAVDVFDLRTQTMYSHADWAMNEARKRFVAVYDPEEEQIFVFGGSIGASWSTCTDSVEVTKTGMEGLCYTSTPTFQPTQQPTYQPTAVPTQPPTQQPSAQPTNQPSAHPTDATDAPTANTNNPTPSPVVATNKPTRKPYTPHVKTEETAPNVYIFMIVVLVIICCIVVFCAWWFSKQDDDDDDESNEALATASCNKCGKAECQNDCGLECQNCKRTECDGNACLSQL